MKTLLIKAERLRDTERWVVNPLGIMSLAASARDAGHQVSLLDLRIERGSEVRSVLDAALDLKPDVVGISALSHHATVARRVLAYVRQRLPDSFLVAGGPLANTDPGFLLEDAGAHACVLGEGEVTFVEILNALSGGGDVAQVAGTCVLRDGEILRAPDREPIDDLDGLPLPAWDLIDLDRYAKFIAMSMRLGKRASLQTSRGCPYRCTFCHNLFGKRFRGRSPGHVLAELKHLRRRYGVRYFEIIDDIFNARRDRAVQILEGIREHLPDCRISFPNGLRADRMDREFVRLLRRAGCIGVYIAVETASPRLQQETGKHLDLEKVRQAALWLREEGIHTSCLFMVGFPGETPDEIDRTFALAAEMPVDLPHVSVVIPYKNTNLWDQIQRSGEGGDARAESLDPHYGFEGLQFGGLPNTLLRDRSLRLARTRLLRNPRNWFVLAAELRARAPSPIALLAKLVSIIAPRRYRRRLAAWSMLQPCFLDR